ncbi:MAG: hypothetical protein VR70_12300 [Rhodospirillaceae bacterium BRH_c57]|nr:MAG: hypothetical protein VR70_12300 [Rhodospirillaceae bacterium BRH_c57]
MMMSWRRHVAPVVVCLLLIACGDGIPDQAEAEQIIQESYQELARAAEAAARAEGEDPSKYRAMFEGIGIQVHGLTQLSDTELTASVTIGFSGGRTKSGPMQLTKGDEGWRAIIK